MTEEDECSLCGKGYISKWETSTEQSIDTMGTIYFCVTEEGVYVHGRK